MKEFAEMVMGEEWLKVFDVEEIKQQEKESVIILREKEDQSPVKREGIVCNGYYNPVEIIDFPVRGKLLFLKFYRRRWRDRDTGEEYANTYEFHKPGMKVSIDFAIFLKENDRDKINELFLDVAYAWDFIEKDFQMVQRGDIRLP